MTLVPVPVQTVNNAPMYAKFAGVGLCAGVWIYFAISHTPDNTGIVEFVKMVLVGLASHLLGTNSQPKPVYPFPPTSNN
jgi:hypothetical protein